jgi:hypothetical protein
MVRSLEGSWLVAAIYADTGKGFIVHAFGRNRDLQVCGAGTLNDESFLRDVVWGALQRGALAQSDRFDAWKIVARPF